MTFSTTRRSRAARLIRTAHDNSTKSSGPHFPTFTRKSIGSLQMDFRVKVGKCGPEDFVELSRGVLIRRAARLRRVVEKVIGEAARRSHAVSILSKERQTTCAAARSGQPHRHHTSLVRTASSLRA